MPPLYVAIDQGGHASRAIVFDHQGHALVQGFAPISVRHPHEGWVEHDPEEMVASIKSALNNVAQQLGERVSRLSAAALVTQRSSIVCWDRQTGQALSPIISWQDRRAADWMAQFDPHNALIHAKTGLFATAHYGVSKMHWCLEHLPAVKQALEQGRLAWGPMASFLLFRLLENKPLLVDPANASRTLLWNLKSLDWDFELLTLFGLPAEPLPRCVPTRHHYGDLKMGAHRVPLNIVNGDQSAALFAFGQPQADCYYVNVGTGAFVQRAVDKYPGFSSRLLTSVVLQESDRAVYVVEGTVNGCGSALDRMRDELKLTNMEQEAPTWLASKKEPPLFLNGVSGLGAPYWRAHFDSRFVGEGEPGQKVAAVIESVVFLISINMQEMWALSPTPKRIIVSGGLAQLDGLCQRLADINRMSVYRPHELEATARGAAYLMAGRPEFWPETQAGELFRPKDDQPLQDRFIRWQDAMVDALAQE